MRAFRLLHLAILSVLVATSAALYAQDEKQRDKSSQEDAKRQEEARRPAQKPEADRPPENRPAENKMDEMKAPHQEESQPSRQEKSEQKQDRNEQKQMEQRDEHQNRQESGQQQHARPQGRGGHIPDEKFHAQFGRTHTFHPPRPQVVNGQPQFAYGGYTFVFVDEWPSDWDYSDDCYVDYDDGE